MGALADRLVPILRERFPGRGMVEGRSPDEPCAAFPGLHPGIRQVAVYDDGHELTVVFDDLTHSHFGDHDEAGSVTEREGRIVAAVVELLDDVFADRIAVWGAHATGGGWYRLGMADSNTRRGATAFVWSGPLL